MNRDFTNAGTVAFWRRHPPRYGRHSCPERGLGIDMYAKVFCQIFDSSIADDFRLRHFFMDLLVLADPNGCVDMTPTAIAARTRIPLEEVQAMLTKLEQPDLESRTPDHDGRRIAKLDDHRTWGWHIINYNRFREIASEEQRREKTRKRVASFRQKSQQNEPCNAPVTLGNAGNAMQKQKQKQKQGEEIPPILKISERISLERELKAIGKELEKSCSLSDHDKGSRSYNRIVELINKQNIIRKQLGVVA